jgi:hypothetical protein
LNRCSLGLGLLVIALLTAGCAAPGGVAADDEYVWLTADGGADAVATTTTTTAAPSISAEPRVAPPAAAIAALSGDGRPLPLPSAATLPGIGTIEPSVVTPSGERRLLRAVNVSVRYDPAAGLEVSPAGVWVINYPLQWITGMSGMTENEIAGVLFDRPAAQLTNYYFYTDPAGGEVTLEPEAGPAPVAVTPGPSLIVDNRSPEASDDNPGTRDAPLRTISEAVARATPGTVIHVYPGTYRERVEIATDGTAEAPIRIEGIRGAAGEMPVITGNDLFSSGVWEPVAGSRGVYAAPAFTGRGGLLSANGQTLVRRDTPLDLAPGEYAVSTGSEAYVDPRFSGDFSPRAGSVYGFSGNQYIWQELGTDSAGFVDLGSDLGEDFTGGVYWGSAWVYVDRPFDAADYQWHGAVDFDLQVSGPFRAAGTLGSALADQPYAYRVWLDGELLPGNVYATADNGEADLPHPLPGRGDFGETWENVVMREGWHHLVFQWDTTRAPGATGTVPQFRFGLPTVVGDAVTSATNPGTGRGRGDAYPFVSEYLVLGPVPAEYDPRVFVRLPDDADPNQAQIDLAARPGPVVSVLGDFVELRGFEIRHGSQADGEALVMVGRRSDSPDDTFAQGVVVEGNWIHDGQYAGVKVATEGDQGMVPIVVRNNWIVNLGAAGIVTEGSSNRLTADTLNDWAPGRTPLVIDYNEIVNAGWAGFARLDDVGGIIVQRATGALIRYNTTSGGGPGITLRGDDYGNRVEGNRIVDPYGWGIGVDANPGPNLVANNIVTGLRAGPEWHQGHLLTADSDQTWMVGNTTDGEWRVDTGWYNDVGSWGAAGPSNVDRVDYDSWKLTRFSRVYFNNLFLGSYLGGVADYEGDWNDTDFFASNYVERPRPDPFDFNRDGAEHVNVRWSFVDRADGDYRIVAGDQLNGAGTSTHITGLVDHDFVGLLRFTADGRSVGAYRPPLAIGRGATVLEAELVDGSMLRVDGAPAS